MQVQALQLLFCYSLMAEVIGEIGTTGVCYSVIGDRLQPSERLLNECCGRKEIGRESAVDWLKNSINQPHVMKMRKPSDGNAFGIEVAASINVIKVGQ